MLFTHGILFAYFLLTFLATATPIPTSLQLLPRSLPELPSDTLLTRDATVLSSLAAGGQVRETSEVTPHIGAHNARIIPQEAHTTAEIERRMEGLASESVKDKSGTEYQSGSVGFFILLFDNLADYTLLQKGSKMDFANTLRRIAVHLPNINDHDLHDIEDVSFLLMHNRVALKTIIGDWPSDSASKHSQEQTIAVKAIHDWEQQLESWTSDGKLKKDQHFVPLSKEAVMTILTCIIKAQDKDPEFMKKMLSPLPAAVLTMSINDSRKVHEKVEEVVQRVQDKWISTWRPDVERMSQDQKIVIGKLEELKRYDFVFNSGFTTNTVSNTVVT